MCNFKKQLVAVIATLSILASGMANATLVLSVIDSVNIGGAFGLAFDGTNIWYSTSGQTYQRIDQNAVGMSPIGPAYVAPVWSAMAFDGTNLAFTQAKSIFYRGLDGSNQGGATLTGGPVGGFNLIDGFDIDHGKVYWSRDISTVDQFDYNTLAYETTPLSGGGGFSGVERVDVGANSFLMVVNDLFNPRQICRTTLAGAFTVADDCATLPNSRYEDLAFDGRYLYAADFSGGRIDKIDLGIQGGGSIFVSTPEPVSLALLGLGLLGLSASRRMKKSV